MHNAVLGYTMPLIYVLTMKRQEVTQMRVCVREKVVAFAQERNLDINPSLCMMDFKISNMNAV